MSLKIPCLIREVMLMLLFHGHLCCMTISERLCMHSQKQSARWAVDVTAQVVPCRLGSWLSCNFWLVLGLIQKVHSQMTNLWLRLDQVFLVKVLSVWWAIPSESMVFYRKCVEHVTSNWVVLQWLKRWSFLPLLIHDRFRLAGVFICWYSWLSVGCPSNSFRN